MDKDDNTLLYILLGAALVYFLMRKSVPTIAAPVSAPPRLLPPAGGGVTALSDPVMPDLSAGAIAATAPIDASNADMGGQDFGVMNPGEGW
jgi:hypothetical protein